VVALLLAVSIYDLYGCGEKAVETPDGSMSTYPGHEEKNDDSIEGDDPWVINDDPSDETSPENTTSPEILRIGMDTKPDYITQADYDEIIRQAQYQVEYYYTDDSIIVSK
jgi:hypothetical protein